jgi:predicted transcriptional regulator
LHKITLTNLLGGVILKGKIIDYDYFEASVVLEDDTIVKVPLTTVSDYLSVGTTVNLNSNDLNCTTTSKSKIYFNNITDFM